MDEFDIFYNKALRFLSFRPRSEKEVRENLNKKSKSHSGKRSAPRIDQAQDPGFTSAHQNDKINVIEKVIEKLKKQRFVDDSEFTKWWIEQRTKFRPRSLRVIKMELTQKGIDKELIESQITNLKSEISNDVEMAKQLVSKKIEKYRGLSKQEIYEKVGGFLARKGFDWETIKDALKEY